MHVIGTAGHIDHGKSTLVQALTGIDPDRLVEEKKREMTIDLGFAWMTLGDEEIGIVDVPGHRDFIENMLAGVGGIDLALFVIAADEGVMPQTREHLAILDLLAVQKGVVALTKIDLVDDPDWLELVTLETNELLQGTALADSPIIPVSAHTQAGLGQLKEVIYKALHEIEPRIDLGRPRLPIDRIFSLPGFGTIVTGTLLDGILHVGDEVEIAPGGSRGRIRGLQTHKAKLEAAQPGSRVAINLTGINRDDLRRGQVITTGGHLKSTQLIDVQYRQLPDADAPLFHNVAVKLFTGASEAPARTRIIGGEQIAPGETGWIQLILDEPIAVLRGDRFIMRRPSPGATIGGGILLDAHPGRRHRRFRSESIERFQSLAHGDPEELLLRTIIRSGPSQAKVLLDVAGLPEKDAQIHLQSLIDSGQIISLGKTLVASSAVAQLSERIVMELGQFHKEEPLREGMDKEALRSRMQAPPPVFNYARESLIDSERITEAGTLLRLPEHHVEFTTGQERSISELLGRMEELGVQSPSVKECKAVVGESVYFALVDQGRLKAISEDVVYSSALYEGLVTRLTEFLHAHGSISAAEARDVLGTSRKYAIALLEHLDELRITRRSGDIRLPAKPFSKSI